MCCFPWQQYQCFQRQKWKYSLWKRFGCFYSEMSFTQWNLPKWLQAESMSSCRGNFVCQIWPHILTLNTWGCHWGDVIKCHKGMRQQFEITLIASTSCFCGYSSRNEVFDQITRPEKVGKVDGSYFRKQKAAFCAVWEREAVFLGLLQWDGSSHLSPCSWDWITLTGSLCTRTSVKIPSSRQAASQPLYTVMRVTALQISASHKKMTTTK